MSSHANSSREAGHEEVSGPVTACCCSGCFPCCSLPIISGSAAKWSDVIQQQAVSILLDHGASYLNREWLKWMSDEYQRDEHADYDADAYEAVLAAAKAGHVGVVRLVLQRVMRRPITSCDQAEVTDR